MRKEYLILSLILIFSLITCDFSSENSQEECIECSGGEFTAEELATEKVQYKITQDDINNKEKNLQESIRKDLEKDPNTEIRVCDDTNDSSDFVTVRIFKLDENKNIVVTKGVQPISINEEGN